MTGYGGQVVIADPHNNLALAYLTSYLSIYELGDDPRFLDLQTGVYNKLQKYLDRKERTGTWVEVKNEIWTGGSLQCYDIWVDKIRRDEIFFKEIQEKHGQGLRKVFLFQGT